MKCLLLFCGWLGIVLDVGVVIVGLLLCLWFI